MSKELAVIDFNEEQVALIKSQIAPKATNDELQLFLYQAKRTGLDPLTRQIYCIHRNVKAIEYGVEKWVSKMTIQTSIDGFRVIAERSNLYGGQSEPEFIEEDGKLKACKVTIYRFRGDVRYAAAVGIAHWNEYAQTDNKGNPTVMWKKMPHTMLAKVAEAIALRKAFPQDLSGLYTADEMSQSDTEMADVTPPKTDKERLGAIADEDMKETLENKNKDTVIRLINAVKKMKSSEELKLWIENKAVQKAINSLEKYHKPGFDSVMNVIEEFKYLNPDDSAKLAQI